VRYILTLILLTVAGTAFAHQQQQMPTQVEQILSQEWNAFQTSQQHVSTAVVKVIEEWRKDKEIMTAERKYWAEYVAGLYGVKSQSMVTPPK
jgi:hypothetical protein